MSTQPLLQRTAQKRIALPIRVEPKVFFANERSGSYIPHVRHPPDSQLLHIDSIPVMAAFLRHPRRLVCRSAEFR